jgi:hypothetical protein
MTAGAMRRPRGTSPRNVAKCAAFGTSAIAVMAAGHFGLGYGGGAHAPDQYYVIESTNAKIQGFDGAAMSFVEVFVQAREVASRYLASPLDVVRLLSEPSHPPSLRSFRCAGPRSV